MIADSVAYCKGRRREVFYDRDTPFFDGFRRNPDYALQTCKPPRMRRHGHHPVRHQRRHLSDEVGAAGGTGPRCLAGGDRHPLPHDCDVAVANTLAAVAQGATQVQGTINAIGERCGKHRPGDDRRQPGAQGRPRCPGARQRRPSDGAVALRLRDRQHEFPVESAVRRPSAFAHKAACTRTPSPRTRRPTSTSTRPW